MGDRLGGPSCCRAVLAMRTMAACGSSNGPQATEDSEIKLLTRTAWTRAFNARRIAGGIVRDLRPMFSGSPCAFSTTLTTLASHASRRTVSTASEGPSSSSHRPATPSCSVHEPSPRRLSAASRARAPRALSLAPLPARCRTANSADARTTASPHRTSRRDGRAQQSTRASALGETLQVRPRGGPMVARVEVTGELGDLRSQLGHEKSR